MNVNFYPGTNEEHIKDRKTLLVGVSQKSQSDKLGDILHWCQVSDQCEQQTQGWWVVVVLVGGNCDQRSERRPPIGQWRWRWGNSSTDHRWPSLLGRPLVSQTQVLVTRQRRGIPGLTIAGCHWSVDQYPKSSGTLVWENPQTTFHQSLVEGQFDEDLLQATWLFGAGKTAMGQKGAITKL